MFCQPFVRVSSKERPPGKSPSDSENPLGVRCRWGIVGLTVPAQFLQPEPFGKNKDPASEVLQARSKINDAPELTADYYREKADDIKRLP